MPYSIVRRCLKKRRGVGLSAPFFMEKFFMELYILSNTVKHRFGDSFGRGTRLSLVGARGERVAFQAILPKPFHNAFAELTANGTPKSFGKGTLSSPLPLPG